LKNPFEREVHGILRDLDVSLSDNMSDIDASMLSDEGREQRKELALAKQDLSEFDEELLE